MNKKNRITPTIKWIFSFFILLFMILAIVFGSIFYLSPNLKKNNLSNKDVTHSNIVLKIQKDNYQTSSKKELAPYKVASIVKEYLQEKGDKLTSNYDVNLVSNSLLEIKSLQDTTQKSQDKLINTLTKKPYLTITDHTGTPLFYKGRFQGNLESIHTLDELIRDGAKNFNMDLDANPATDKIPEGYADRIQIKLNDYAWHQFTQLAFLYFRRSFQTQNRNPEDPKNKVYFWLNLDEFIRNAKENDKANWEAAKNNPVNYAYVNHNPGEEKETNKNGKVTKVIKPFLKNSINAQRYLISAVSPISLISSKKRDSIFYLINNSPNGYSNRQLTSLINFSYTPFLLEKQSASLNVKKVYQFDSYILAILIIYIAMTLFLVTKHRLMGMVSAVAMAFVLFVLLSVITAFGVAINSLIALSIILVLFVVFNILIKKLQIFNKEIYEGSNPTKAINKASKKAIISGFDLLVVLGIGSIISFYLNINHSSTLGAIIGLSCLLIGIIILGLNTLTLKSMIQTEAFELNKKALLPLKQSHCKLSNKIEMFFKTKFFIIPLIVILLAALIIYAVFAAKNNSVLLGLNANSYFIKDSLINSSINSLSLSNTNIGYLVGWSTLTIVLINLAVSLYITIRHSLQSAFIYLIKQSMLSLLLISFLVITRIKIDSNVLDAFLIISFINILNSMLQISRVNFEIKKDINTKNFIYSEDAIKDIFKSIIIDILFIQHINLFLGILLLGSSPFLLVNTSFSVIFGFGLSLIVNWYLNLFIIPKIWVSILATKYKNKQKRINAQYWKTEAIVEQTFIEINDFLM